MLQKPLTIGMPASPSPPMIIAARTSGMRLPRPPIWRMSRVPTPWMTAPAQRKSRALKTAWLSRWNWLAKTPPAPIAYTMYPSWLTVECASTRLRSFDTTAISAARIAVIAPTARTVARQPGTVANAG